MIGLRAALLGVGLSVALGVASSLGQQSEHGIELTDAAARRWFSDMPANGWLSAAQAEELWRRAHSQPLILVHRDDTKEPNRASSCAELARIAPDSRPPTDTAGMGAFGAVMRRCFFLQWAQSGVRPRSSFIPAMPLGEDTAALLSWRYLPLVRGDEISSYVRQQNLSLAELRDHRDAWIKYDDRDDQLVIALYDEDEPMQVNCYATTLRLIARGDVDGDGLEDIVVFFAQGSHDMARLGQARSDNCGTMSFGTLQVLTRRSATARYEVVCPHPQNAAHLAFVELWTRFSGACIRG